MRLHAVPLVLVLSACGVTEKEQTPVAAGWSGVSSRSDMCEVIHSDLASIYQGQEDLVQINQSYLLGGSGVGNGGDPLRVIFERARGDAAKRVASHKSCELPKDTEAKVVDWLDMHRDELVQDIKNTQHVWLEKPQATCARTLLARDMPVTLSFEVCRSKEVDRSIAAELLVHESVHHFGIEDETEADKIAHAVMAMGEGTCSGKADDDQDDDQGDDSAGSATATASSGGSGGSSASASSGRGGAAAACAGGNGSAAAASSGGAASVSCSGNGSSSTASSGGQVVSRSSGSTSTTTTTTSTTSSSTPSPVYYGSLAFSKDTGKIGMSWLQPSIDASNTQAVAQCDAEDCESVVWVRSGCAAIVVSVDSNESYKWGWASDRATAISLAEEACKQAFTSCKAPTSVCSG